MYDDLGQLVACQDTTGEFEQFLWHDNQMVGAYTATGATRWEAVWGTGQDVLLGFFDHMAGRNVIPVRDWRNNVVSVYQPGAACTGCTPGASLGRAEYTAEGRVTTYAPDNTVICFEEGSGQVCPMPGNLPFAFNGQWRSPLTGLSYMRNRWYSPRLGQFISHDPLHYVDSTNLYAFAAFDPINSWDPLGLCRDCETPRSPTEEDLTRIDEVLQIAQDAGWSTAYADTMLWLPTQIVDDPDHAAQYSRAPIGWPNAKLKIDHRALYEQDPRKMAATLIHESAHYAMHRLGHARNNPAIWAWLNHTYGWWNVRENYERIGWYLQLRAEDVMEKKTNDLTIHDWQAGLDAADAFIPDRDTQRLVEKEYFGREISRRFSSETNKKSESTQSDKPKQSESLPPVNAQ